MLVCSCVCHGYPSPSSPPSRPFTCTAARPIQGPRAALEVFDERLLPASMPHHLRWLAQLTPARSCLGALPERVCSTCRECADFHTATVRWPALCAGQSAALVYRSPRSTVRCPVLHSYQLLSRWSCMNASRLTWNAVVGYVIARVAARPCPSFPGAAVGALRKCRALSHLVTPCHSMLPVLFRTEENSSQRHRLQWQSQAAPPAHHFSAVAHLTSNRS